MTETNAMIKQHVEEEVPFVHLNTSRESSETLWIDQDNSSNSTSSGRASRRTSYHPECDVPIKSIEE